MWLGSRSFGEEGRKQLADVLCIGGDRQQGGWWSRCEGQLQWQMDGMIEKGNIERLGLCHMETF